MATTAATFLANTEIPENMYNKIDPTLLGNKIVPSEDITEIQATT